MKKTALITGINGQDAYYLSQLLLNKDYHVVGTSRRPWDIAESLDPRIQLEFMDLLDRELIVTVLSKVKPDEIYQLAGMTHARESEAAKQLTYNINCNGPSNLALIAHRLNNDVRIFHPLSSYMYEYDGQTIRDGQESTNPMNPYGESKKVLMRYLTGSGENLGYNVKGVMFNHESLRRPACYVTRKITQTLARIKTGTFVGKLQLGGLDACRDWGWAPDFVEGMWLSLQQEKDNTYVFGTGVNYTVRDLVQLACKTLEMDPMKHVEGWGYSPIQKRSNETIFADPSRTKDLLWWSAKHTVVDFIPFMASHDLEAALQGSPLL